MATGVAKTMKDQFGAALDVQLHLVDSDEAKKYALRGSTSVFLGEEWVPLETAMSEAQMALFLGGKLAA